MKVYRCYYTKVDIEVRCSALVLAKDEDAAKETIKRHTIWPIYEFKCEELEYMEGRVLEEVDLD